MADDSEQLRGTWRTALGKTYLAAEDFEKDQELTLKIQSVTREKVIDPGTKETKLLITLHFEKTNRTLALNVTNARRIHAIAKTPRVDKWVGVEITLHIEVARSFGKMANTIRVKE